MLHYNQQHQFQELLVIHLDILYYMQINNGNIMLIKKSICYLPQYLYVIFMEILLFYIQILIYYRMLLPWFMGFCFVLLIRIKVRR